MNIKKISIIVFFITVLFVFNDNLAYAYTCEYSGSGSTLIEGCGNFTIEVSKGVASASIEQTYKNNIKFTTPGMQYNEFTVTQGWKDFASSQLNGECPDVYYRKNRDGNYCDVHFGFGDNDASMSDNYLFAYGTNLSDPDEPEPVVPDSNSDELYYVAGIEGHKYADAGTCIYGEPRNVYVKAVDKTIVACISKNTDALPSVSDDDPDISCGYAQYHIAFKATKVENGKVVEFDTSDRYYAGVCYGVSLDPDYDPSKDIPTHEVTMPSVESCNDLLGDPTTKGTPAYYLVAAFRVIKYVAIILLVVLTVLDYMNAMASNDQEAVAKATKKAIKRFVLCIIIFLLPVLLQYGLSFLHKYKIDLCGIS